MDPDSEPLAGLRVLVVEDHADTREIVELILVAAGATVTTAASAEDALVVLGGADVVVTDYRLGGETGMWLLARIRERPAPIPVLLMTGLADINARELESAGFARILKKPVDPFRLCEEVRAVVRGR
jgi:CheY-like chemotaxis protein